MTPLNDEQLTELICIRKTQTELGKPLSLHRKTWRGETGDLARRRLVSWRKGGAAWGPSFREVSITETGVALLDSIPAEQRERLYETAMSRAPEMD